MKTNPVCDICGTASPPEVANCIHCGCSLASEPGSFADVDASKIAAFGFHAADIGTGEFQAAEAVFLAGLGGETSKDWLNYRREAVCENGDAYYFPFGWIGCSGHLVIKSNLQLISFGSYIGAAAHIRAYYRGFHLAPRGVARRNTLIIRRIRDMDNTVRILKTFLRAEWVESELILKPPRLPIVIENMDLYFCIRDLLEAEDNDWFGFEVGR